MVQPVLEPKKSHLNDNVSTPLMPGSAMRSAFALHELLGHVESKSLTIGLNTSKPYTFVE